MQIGIISDTHNKISKLYKAVEILNARSVSFLIHCGDLTDDRLIGCLNGFRVYFAYGNTDFSIGAIDRALNKIDPLAKSGYSLDFHIENKRFFVAHGDTKKILVDAINSNNYDYILTGHTHQFCDERINRSRLINPGALGGNQGEHSFAILDTELDLVEQILING